MGSFILPSIRLAFLCFICLLLGNCATTIPTDYESPVSTALADPEETELGRFFQHDISAHPGKSGVALVATGEQGFRARGFVESG